MNIKICLHFIVTAAACSRTLCMLMGSGTIGSRYVIARSKSILAGLLGGVPWRNLSATRLHLSGLKVVAGAGLDGVEGGDTTMPRKYKQIALFM